MAALAERVGVSQVTLRNIETGEPTVGIGVVFEAATIVGVALFHESSQRRSFEVDRVNDRLALLPKKVHTPSDLDDDF